MAEAIVISYTDYKREGLSYVATITYGTRYFRGSITLKLDFITYHVLGLIHGDQVYTNMISDRIERLKSEIINGKE